MAKKKVSTQTNESQSQNPTVDALKETLKKVEASLVPAVDSFCSGSRNDDDEVLPANLGLDFLHVKNTLLLSYLIDLLVHLRDTVEPLPADGDEESKEEEESQQLQQRRRLLEMRTVLDKSRGLDKKLRYQINKLLSSLTDSSAFATGGVGTNDDNAHGDEHDGEDQEGPTNDLDNPLRYRPDPKSMLDDSENDSRSEEEDDDDDSNQDGNTTAEEDEDEDEDLAAARATLSISKQKKSKKKAKTYDDDDDDDADTDGFGDGGTQKYIAPRLTAVPYTHDVADKKSEQEKRQRRKLRASELAQTLRQQYGDQPDTEDVFGGGNSELYGKQRSASRALAQKEAERIEFEESTMVRLTTSRKEKKEKKRIERMLEGGTNLAQIANLGNLVRETEAFGRDNTIGDSDDEYGERERALQAYMSGEQDKNKISGSEDSRRYANGKRRREAPGSKMGKRPKAYNSLQAALYGGGTSSAGSKSKKKKKSRR